MAVLDYTAPPPVIPPVAPPYQASQATAQQATSTGYDPSAFTVDAPQTVQGQLDTIIAADSPLMQQAARRAQQAANDRGLLNSSIAVGEGQQAVIGAAMPIAQQDAGVFNQAMTNTINAQNAAKAFTAGASNTAELTNAQLGTNVSVSNAEMENQPKSAAYSADLALKEAGLSAQTQTLIANLDSATRLAQTQLTTDTQLAITNLDNQRQRDLALLTTQNQALLQSNTNASNMFADVVRTIAAIQVDQTLTPAAKDQAIANQLNLLNQGLMATAQIASTPPPNVYGLNLDQYFQQAGTEGQNMTTVPVANNLATAQVGQFPPGTDATHPAPALGSDFWNSPWSDGQQHSPPPAGQTYYVPGYGWAASDGMLYADQATALAANYSASYPYLTNPTGY